VVLNICFSHFNFSRRERHAKTIDIAQEEILTCIGIYLYERFHLIYQTMKSEEQTWILLFYSSIHTLKKCLEVKSLYLDKIIFSHFFKKFIFT
jgi:hypothetical protein